MEKKGMIVIYVNRDDNTLEKQSNAIDLINSLNSVVFTTLKEYGFHNFFITTANEASRVEKIDFDKPFPRNLSENGLQ